MKVLIIEDKKCFFKIKEEEEKKSIEDITGEDIKTIIESIYSSDEILLDKLTEDNHPANPIHFEMYKNLFIELDKVIKNKKNILEEIESKIS